MAVAVKQKRKSTSHTHRKRTGAHQKRSTHFMKAYWPYVPIAFLVGVTMFANTMWLKPSVLSYATNMSSTGLLNGTNSERVKNGLGSLALNATLTKAAQAKANDMAARDYWSHNTPDGEEPWVFITEAGYRYSAAGENLAYGFLTHDDAIIGWMNSPGHRANILNDAYTEVGFGIVNSANYQSNGEQTIVVAMYAKPSASVATQTPTTSEPTPTQEPATPAQPKTEETDQSEQPAASNPVESLQPIAVKNETRKEPSRDSIPVTATVPGQQKVARVQIATSGAAPWSLFAASTLAVILTIFFITRHSVAWHRAVVRGEKFFLKHKLLDMIIVSTILIAAVLTQTVGFIQ